MKLTDEDAKQLKRFVCPLCQPKSKAKGQAKNKTTDQSHASSQPHTQSTPAIVPIKSSSQIQPGSPTPKADKADDKAVESEESSEESDVYLTSDDEEPDIVKTQKTQLAEHVFEGTDDCAASLESRENCELNFHFSSHTQPKFNTAHVRADTGIDLKFDASISPAARDKQLLRHLQVKKMEV